MYCAWSAPTAWTDAATVGEAASRLRALRTQRRAEEAAEHAQEAVRDAMAKASEGAAGAAAVEKRLDEVLGRVPSQQQQHVAALGMGGSGGGEASSSSFSLPSDSGAIGGSISGIQHAANTTTDTAVTRGGASSLSGGGGGGEESVVVRARPSAMLAVQDMPSDAQLPAKVTSDAVRELLAWARRGVSEGQLRSSQTLLRESV